MGTHVVGTTPLLQRLRVERADGMCGFAETMAHITVWYYGNGGLAKVNSLGGGGRCLSRGGELRCDFDWTRVS